MGAGASTYAGAGKCARAARPKMRSAGLVLVLDRAADDVGHVGAVLLLFLEEGLVVLGAGGSLLVLALDDHQVLALALGRLRLGLGRHEGRLLGGLAGGLFLGGSSHGVGRQGQLVGGFADRADDR